jgi:hypothetical protein
MSSPHGHAACNSISDTTDARKEDLLMGRFKSITAAACAALLVSAAAAAQPADRSTFVTFSGPVSIPGKTLPAGTYTFKLADSPSDRHIVQIFDKDQTQLFATILAVPAERNAPEGEPVITFRETPSNKPPALRYWYYAGEKSGNEFVYPRSQAMTIARASGEGVMSMDTETGDVTQWKGTPERVTANAEPQTATTASTATTTSTAATTTAEPTTQPTTAQPTTTPAQPTTAPAQPTTTPTEPTTTSQPMTAQPTTTQPTTAPEQPATTAPRSTADRPTGTSGRSEPSELPRTAGELPLVGLIALAAFAGAFALRAARKAAV